MSREIKFREPLFNDNVFHKFHYWGCWDGYFYKPISSLPDKSQEYTGLHDKNGKEIYEGDIVKCASSFGCPHEVQWSQVPNGNLGYYYCWYLSGLGEGYTFTGQEEIIGNIYENPELLNHS